VSFQAQAFNRIDPINTASVDPIDDSSLAICRPSNRFFGYRRSCRHSSFPSCRPSDRFWLVDPIDVLCLWLARHMTSLQAQAVFVDPIDSLLLPVVSATGSLSKLRIVSNLASSALIDDLSSISKSILVLRALQRGAILLC